MKYIKVKCDRELLGAVMATLIDNEEAVFCYTVKGAMMVAFFDEEAYEFYRDVFDTLEMVVVEQRRNEVEFMLSMPNVYSKEEEELLNEMYRTAEDMQGEEQAERGRIPDFLVRD